MKNLIIYTSQTGFTKRYAEWLAEKMNADMFDLKDVQKKDGSFFEEYETNEFDGLINASLRKPKKMKNRISKLLPGKLKRRAKQLLHQ